MSTTHDHHEPFSLPVLQLRMPDRCGPDEAACERCVMRFLERRAEAGDEIGDSDRLLLTIPISALGTPHARERVRRRIRRSGIAARLGSDTETGGDAIELEFERGRCPLHELTTAMEGIGIRLRLEQARVSVAGEDTPSPGMRPLRDAAHAVYSLARRERGLTLVAMGGLFLICGAITHWTGGPEWLRIVLLALASVASSTATFPEAIRELRSFRLSVDTLMFAAAAGAAALGHYEEGAFLLFLFGLGAAGEELALHRARSAIDALTEITPDTARVLDDNGDTSSVPVESVMVGSHLSVRPFERLPLDGEIVHGRSSLDQSAVTGESVPVDVGPGDPVLAGVINGDRPLVVRTTRLAGESTLARILRLVEEAQAEKSSTELFTARIERVYVPIVFVLTVLLIVLPPLLTDIGFGVTFYRAMAFLVAGSPCALAIGTPAAVLCSMARAARMGVIIKGGGHLETLARLRAAAFDKTGTLTTGQPAVTSVIPLGDTEADDLLAMAAAIEGEINHPIADAIRSAARARGLTVPEATGVEQTVAVGAIGTIGGVRVGVGKRSLASDVPAEADKAQADLAGEGNSCVWVVRDGQAAGLLAIADSPRETTAAGISDLRSVGIVSVAMLTGDHEPAALAIGATVGIEDVRANLLPEDKLDAIDELRNAHGPIVMVGDGVNDAPALARADLGIAIGAAGNDVAMQTADVAVMSGDLRRIADTIRLARRTRTIVTQNLILAMGVIAVVAPLGAAGIAPLGLAVVLHEGSTVVVVLNALRLLRQTGDAQRSGRPQARPAGAGRDQARP